MRTNTVRAQPSKQNNRHVRSMYISLYHGQKKKDKNAKNNLQNTTQKTKDLAILTPQVDRTCLLSFT